MRYVTRVQWGARDPKYRNVMARPVSEAYIHHGGGGSQQDDPFRVVPSWQLDHMYGSHRWSDIAYQEIISGAREYDGWVFEGRGFGFQGGATGEPEDARSLSICVIGNFEHDVPTAAVLESIAQRLAYQVKIGRLTPDFALYGDRDANQTACPGANLYARLGEIRRRVDAIVAANEPTPAPPTDPPEEDDPMAVQWLFYGETGTKTQWVVTPDGTARFYGPEAIKALIAEKRISSTPVMLPPGSAEQFRAGNK